MTGALHAMRRAAVALLATTLVGAAPPPAQQRDPALLVEAMTAAAGRHRHVRALVRSETREGERSSIRFFESFVDVAGGRVRTLQRDFGRATPHLLSVHDGERLRQQQLEIGEVAESIRARPLVDALKVVTAGELLPAAFSGRPPLFDAAGLKPSRCDGPGESVAGVGCTRLDFAGNTTGTLWIADVDLFPRRLAVTIGARTVTEEVLELDLDPRSFAVEFELSVPEGRRLRSIAEARAEWARDLGPEESRWPQPEDDSPDFAAVDLESRLRMFSETGEQEVILCFFNPEVANSVERALDVDRAWGALSSRPTLLWLVAAGRGPGPVEAALGGRTPAGQLVIAGEHAKNAFQQFSIWRTPAFVRVLDMQVMAATGDAATAIEWLR
jgi:hypothetical protein